MTEMKKHIYDENNAFGMNALAIIIFRFLPYPPRNSTPLVNGDGCTGTTSKSIVRSSLMT